MRGRNRGTLSFVLTIGLAASAWANCAGEMAASEMACCMTAEHECGPAEPSDSCCKAEEKTQQDSIAARSERPTDGIVTSSCALAVVPHTSVASPACQTLAMLDVRAAASPPPSYLLDTVLRV